MKLAGLVFALCGLAVAAPGLEAQAKRSGPEPVPPPPLQLAEWLDQQRPQVLLVTVARQRSIGRGSVALTLDVEQRLWEPRGPTEAQLLVLGYAGRLRAGERALVFLRGFREGPRYELLKRVRAADEDFAAKLKLVREVIPLLQHPTRARREAAAFELVFSSLLHGSAWRRRWALTELQWQEAAHPALLTALRRRRLAQLLPSIGDPALRAGVESVAAAPARDTDP